MRVTEYPVELHLEAAWNLERRPGISVIIPTCNGVETLSAALSSIVNQTIDHSLIEVVVIENGPEGGARDLVKSFQQTGCYGSSASCSIDWIYIQSQLSGAGLARNIGLSATTREYITYLDDDDSIELRYLEALYEVAGSNIITVTGIADVTPEGDYHLDTLLNERIEALPTSPTGVGAHPWLLGFNACKLIPWELLRSVRYDEQLKSGEDVVFYAHLLKKQELDVVRVKKTGGARYVRNLRQNSLSRRENSFDFSVRERLDSIKRYKQSRFPGKTPRQEQAC